MSSTEEIILLKKAWAREKMARAEAEKILEEKSMELYHTNNQLKELNVNLEREVEFRIQEAKQTESLFQDLIGAAADIIFKTDLSGNFTYINSVAEKLSGFSQESFINKNFQTLIRADYKEKLASHFYNQVKNRAKESYVEYPVITSSGKTVWLGQSTNLIFEDGEPKEFFALARNITKRIETEQKLSFSTTRLEAIITNLNSGILVEDANRRISLSNQKFCDLFSLPFSYGNLIGEDCSNMADEIKGLFKESNKFLKRISELLSNRESVFSDIIYLVDGKILERDYVPLFSMGEFIGQVWQYRDVTIQHQQDLIIKKSEEKYRGVIENLELGILEVDKSDKITKAYKQFTKLSGYSEEELIGVNPSELLLSDKFKAIMNQQVSKRMKGVSSAYEVPLKKKNGDVAWVIISGAPFFNANGEFEGTMGIHLDITERKQSESDLIKAKLKAEELIKIKELFLANMSHEIRTPMNAIIGMGELIEKTSLNNDQRTYVEAIQSSSSHLLNMINDILDISKMESGKMELDSIPFRVREMIDRIIDMVKVKAETNHVEIELIIEKNLPDFLTGDRMKISQVLINLIGNAIKFTLNGKVTISVKCVNFKGALKEVKFSVKDQGIGIKKEDFELIFENFKQVGNSSSRFYGGTGLGLPISSNIVKLLGGEIKLISEINEGSEFYFTIPLYSGKDVENLKGEEEKHTLITDFKGAKVLLVEDNPVNSLLATTVLKKWKCKVTAEVNGVDALKVLNEHDFDLILMDLQMPIMGGLEATRIIREERNINTPIIALTANAIKGDMDMCLRAGMNDYMSKPFKQVTFNLKLSRWLNS